MQLQLRTAEEGRFRVAFGVRLSFAGNCRRKRVALRLKLNRI